MHPSQIARSFRELDLEFAPYSLIFSKLDVLARLCIQPSHTVDSSTTLTALTASFPVSGHNLFVPSVYPLFADCTSFDELVTVSVHFVASSLDLARARAAATTLLASPSTTLDTRRMESDTSLLWSRGIYFLLASRQQDLAASCLSRSALALASPNTPLGRRVSLLAEGRNLFLFPPDYVPNGGVRIRPFPDSFAPHDVIAAHFALLQRAGKYVILRESVWLAYAIRESIPFSYALCFLAPKSSALLRLVSFRVALIHPSKKAALEAL